MSERTQLHSLVPWTGGLNTASDPGFTNDNDLVLADNIEFATNGSRQKREGLEYFDAAVPTSTHRSSSGTTRTIRITDLQTVDNQYLVLGESVLVESTSTAYNTPTAVTITAISASTFSYTHAGSLTEGSTSDTTISVTRANQYLNLLDYWYTDGSNVKQQLLMAVTDNGKIFKYDVNGDRLEVTTTGTAPTTVAHANTIVFNDKYICCFDAIGDKPIKYDPDVATTYTRLGDGTGSWSGLGAQYGATTTDVPDASFMVSWQGRLWANNKTDPDRIYFSAIGDGETWGGYGDSGAIPVGVLGEGDTDGIVAAWPFKNMLFVRKGRKTYRIVGDYSPDTYVVEEVTGSIGGVAQAAQAAMGDNDIVWVSKKGIHSGSVTDQYGDVTSNYLSAKIQPTFNDFELQRADNFMAVHLETLNTVFFAVTDGGESSNGDIYAYNYSVKEWFRWPNIDCPSIAHRDVAGIKKLVVGTSDARVLMAQSGDFVDYGTTGIVYRILTPTIYPNKDLISLKAFYRLRLYYKPVNRLTITIIFKVDGRMTQTQTIQHVASGDTLGNDFVLGSSVLGSAGVLAPYSVPVTGIGRGCTVELQVSGSNEQVNIYGMDIEYENLDISPEVNE